jgi:hypothetical protein
LEKGAWWKKMRLKRNYVCIMSVLLALVAFGAYPMLRRRMGEFGARGLGVPSPPVAPSFARRTAVAHRFAAPAKLSCPGCMLMEIELFYDVFLVNDSLVFVGREVGSPTDGLYIERSVGALSLHFPATQPGLRAGSAAPPTEPQRITHFEGRRDEGEVFAWRYTAPWLAGVEGDVAVEVRYADVTDAPPHIALLHLPQLHAAGAAASRRPRFAVCTMLSEHEAHLARAWTAYYFLHGFSTFHFYVIPNPKGGGTDEVKAVRDAWDAAGRNQTALAAVRAPFAAAAGEYLASLSGELLRALEGLPVDVAITPWRMSNADSNPHFMVLTSCYQRHRVDADVIAFYDIDEFPVVPGSPSTSLRALLAPLVPSRWLAMITSSVWAHLPARALPLEGAPRFHESRPYPRMPLAAFAAAPLISEGRDSGGREKYVVNTREARAAGVEIVNNHGIYAHEHGAVHGVPPAPSKTQTERALVYRLPLSRAYHAHVNNLKGPARWPLKGDTVSDAGVADHVHALSLACRSNRAARSCTSDGLDLPNH